MALKQGSSSGVDVVDVSYVLAAFQEMNRCVLHVTVTLEGTPSSPKLALRVSAWSRPIVDVEPALLASQKSIVGSTGPRTLEAAILQSLYALDAILLDEEFARVNNK